MAVNANVVSRVVPRAALILLAVGVASSLLHAQDAPAAPAAAPKVWAGSLGAGFALTGGNSETTNFNLSFNAVRDPKTRNLIKLSGLYLRGSQDDETNLDRLTLGFRDEYKFSDRVFGFGEFGYLRDPFKEISYLINPVGGIGYKLILTDTTEFVVDGGVGAVWEKNPGFETDTSGSLNAGQSFTYKLSDRANVYQGLTGLWKTSDFDDAFYHFKVGLATTIIKSMELKVEFADDYKNKVVDPTVKKNDTAFLTTFLYKF